MFKDDQRLILDFIVADRLKKAKELFGIIYHDNSAMLRFMKENRMPSPKPFRTAAEVILSSEIDQALSTENLDLETLQRLIDNSKSLSINLDWRFLAFKANEKIDNEFDKLSQKPENIETLKKIDSLIRIVNKLPVNLNLWQSQNIAFKIAENQYKDIKNRKDEASQAWVLAFRQLCELIGVRLD